MFAIKKIDSCLVEMKKLTKNTSDKNLYFAFCVNTIKIIQNRKKGKIFEDALNTGGIGGGFTKMSWLGK